MTSKRIAQTNQQQKSEKPQASGILQRAAVRSVSDAGVQSTDDKEAQPLSNSALSKDFSRVPISTTKPQQIMAKLMIGAVGDKYEQEADRVAAQVVQQINAPASVRSGEDETVQREEMETKDNETRLMRSPILQRKSSDGGMTATPDLEASINRARGGGQPLANNVREPMEKAFGADFSGVKVHTDAQANQLNQSIQARAFTTGQDVFFRQGAYEPGNRGGQELIAHELTHVVQQNVGTVQRSQFTTTSLLPIGSTATTGNFLIASAPSTLSLNIQPKLTIGKPGDRYEQEADRVVAQIVNQINAPKPQQPDQSQSIQRKMIPENEQLQMQNTQIESFLIQRMTIQEYDGQQKSEEDKISEKLKKLTEEESNMDEQKKENIEKYLKNIPVEYIIESSDNPEYQKWKNALYMLFDKLNEKFVAPPNPYELISKNAYLYRGTSKNKEGEIFIGNEGSKNNTPTTPSPAIGAIFALKNLFTEPKNGFVLVGKITDVEKFGFSPPDVMSGNEQELTIQTSPKEVAKIFKEYDVKLFRDALKTVGIDLSEYTQEKFDSWKKRMGRKKLTDPEEQQLLNMLDNPEQIHFWNSLDKERDEATKYNIVETGKFKRTKERELDSNPDLKPQFNEVDQYLKNLDVVIQEWTKSVLLEKMKEFPAKYEEVKKLLKPKLTELYEAIDKAPKERHESDEELDLFS